MNICWVRSGMPGHVQLLQKEKAAICPERAELFCLFVACSFTSMKTRVLLCLIIVGYWPACLKFSEATNQQNLWKGSIDFVDFLQLVIWILLDIHWSHKNMTFSTVIVKHKFTPNQIVKCFKLKNLTNDMRYQDHLFLSMKLEEMLR